MKRLYFTAPNVESARKTVNDLLLARIPENHIHVIAKEGTPLEDLPSASFFQRSDLGHAVEQGLALGGAAGVLAGVVAISLPGAGLVLGGGAIVLATTLAGASIGAWSASLRALNIPNSHHAEFEQDLERGEVLMLVDVHKDRVEEIRALIGRTHVEVHDRGMEKTMPHFP